jgi:hypothetical protein
MSIRQQPMHRTPLLQRRSIFSDVINRSGKPNHTDVFCSHSSHDSFPHGQSSCVRWECPECHRYDTLTRHYLVRILAEARHVDLPGKSCPAPQRCCAFCFCLGGPFRAEPCVLRARRFCTLALIVNLS